MKIRLACLVVALCAGMLTQPLFGGTIAWVAWTCDAACTAGTATGTITFSNLSTIPVTFTGPLADSHSQINNIGSNHFASNPSTYTSSTVSNYPPLSDEIAISDVATYTITFGSAVTNPVMAIISLGGNGNADIYTFTGPTDIAVLSTGNGWYGNDNQGPLTRTSTNTLHGTEANGTIQLLGTFTSFSWAPSTNENWQEFTVGVPDNSVPEPASALLLLSGLGALAALAVRRRQSL